MKLLWLASWYPNTLAPLSGDFLKRHAEAVSIYEDVHVIYVMRDPYGEITKDICINEISEQRLKETIVYYYIRPFPIPIIDKFFSEIKYRRLFKQHVIKSLFERKADLTHVQIGMKAGTIARWIKKKYRIPYVVSEQWTGLLPEADDNLNVRPFYWRNAYKKIMEDAISTSAVSNYLADAIKKKFSVAECVVIPNVVNKKIFFPQQNKKRSHQKKFLHVSTLTAFKNPELILQAFAIVLKTYSDAELTIVGPAKESMLHWIKKNDLINNILFHQEMSQPMLSDLMRESDALILYSKFETFGCVVIEANACGLPVIASDIPVLHEIINNKINGLFAPPEDINALAQTIIKFITAHSIFDSKLIASETKDKYSYEKIGERFSNWYSGILRH
jgi:glycosyltransferase involved in cell wall biosynthesis